MCMWVPRTIFIALAVCGFASVTAAVSWALIKGLSPWWRNRRLETPRNRSKIGQKWVKTGSKMGRRRGFC